MGKQVITAFEITKAINAGQKALDLKETDCIVTPEARDMMEESGIGFAGGTCPVATVEKNFSESAGAGSAEAKSASPPLYENKDLTARICDLVRDKLPEAGGQELETLVQQVVADRLLKPAAAAQSESSGAVARQGGVSLIKGDLLFDPSSQPAIPGKVQLSETVRCHQDSPLTVTCMKWENTLFERVVESPEISMVVDGEFTLNVEGRTFTARPGDILYMEKGAKVSYASNADVKLVCISA